MIFRIYLKITYTIKKNETNFSQLSKKKKLKNNNFIIIKYFYNSNIKSNFLAKTKNNRYFNFYFQLKTENYKKINLNINEKNIVFLDYFNDKFIIWKKIKEFYEINIISDKFNDKIKIDLLNLKFIIFDYSNQYFMFFNEKKEIIIYTLNYVQGTKLIIDDISNLKYKNCFYNDLNICKKRIYKNNLNLFINKLNIDNYYLGIDSKYYITFEINQISNYFFISELIYGFINDIWIQKTHNFLNNSISDIYNDKIKFIIFKYLNYNFFLEYEVNDIHIIKNDKDKILEIAFLNYNDYSFFVKLDFDINNDFNKNLNLNLKFEKTKINLIKNSFIIKMIKCKNYLFYLLKNKNLGLLIYFGYNNNNRIYLLNNWSELSQFSDFLCAKNKLLFLFKNKNDKNLFFITYFNFINKYFYNLNIKNNNYENSYEIKEIFLLDKFLIEYYENKLIIRLLLIDNEIVKTSSTKLINLMENDLIYINKKLDKILIIKMNKFNHIDSVNEYDLNCRYHEFFNDLALLNLSKKYDFYKIDKTLKVNHFNKKINIFNYLIWKNKNNDYFWLDFDKINRLVFYRSNFIDNNNNNLNNIEKTFEFKVKHLDKDFYIYIIKNKTNYSIFLFFNSFLWLKNLNLYYINFPSKNELYIFNEYLLIQNKFTNSIKLLNVKIQINNNFLKINKDEKYLLTGYVWYFFKGNNYINLFKPITFLKNSLNNLDLKSKILAKKFDQNFIIFISKNIDKYYINLTYFYEENFKSELILKFKFIYNFKNIIIQNDKIFIFLNKDENNYCATTKINDIKNKKKIYLKKIISKYFYKIILFNKNYFISSKNKLNYFKNKKIENISIEMFKFFRYYKIFIDINKIDYIFIVLKNRIIVKIISDDWNEKKLINYVDFKNNNNLNIIYMFYNNKNNYLITKNDNNLSLYKIINGNIKKINELSFGICNKILKIENFKENNLIFVCKSSLHNIYIFNFKFDQILILLMFYITEIIEDDTPFDMIVNEKNLYISSSVFHFKIFEINEKLNYLILNKKYDEIEIKASNNYKKNSIMVKNYANKFQLFVRHFIRNKLYVSILIGGIIIFYLWSVIYLYYKIFK